MPRIIRVSALGSFEAYDSSTLLQVGYGSGFYDPFCWFSDHRSLYRCLDCGDEVHLASEPGDPKLTPEEKLPEATRPMVADHRCPPCWRKLAAEKAAAAEAKKKAEEEAKAKEAKAEAEAKKKKARVEAVQAADAAEEAAHAAS